MATSNTRTQLFERVLFEDLKTRNVQDADERRLDLLAQRLVDALDQPQKQTVVQRLGQRITRIGGLCCRTKKSERATFTPNEQTYLMTAQVRLDNLATGTNLGTAQRVVQILIQTTQVNLMHCTRRVITQAHLLVAFEQLGTLGDDVSVLDRRFFSLQKKKSKLKLKPFRGSKQHTVNSRLPRYKIAITTRKMAN